MPFTKDSKWPGSFSFYGAVFADTHGEYNEILSYKCEERYRQIEILYGIALSHNAQAVLFGHNYCFIFIQALNAICMSVKSQ
jgi:hypothetical protein